MLTPFKLEHKWITSPPAKDIVFCCGLSKIDHGLIYIYITTNIAVQTGHMMIHTGIVVYDKQWMTNLTNDPITGKTKQ